MLKSKKKEWAKEGLIFGTTMFAIMSVGYPLFNQAEFNFTRLILEALIWIIAGLGFGLTTNYLRSRVKKS